MININKQVPIKQDSKKDGVTVALDVREVFDSIQGEGPLAGIPATFIRLGGCNIQCTFCDEDYTTRMTSFWADELVTLCKHSLVVITGGEPFAQNITPLVNALLDAGKSVQVETNGTLSCPGFPWEEVTVVVSPKTGKLNKAVLAHATVYKYVVGVEDKDSVDGMPTQSTQGASTPPARPGNERARVYLMPRDDKDSATNEANNLTAYHLCMKFNKLLTVQMHKVIGVK